MSKIYCFADNGVSGYWGIIYPDGSHIYEPVPIKKCLNYTKEKQMVNRIDVDKLKDFLQVNMVDKSLPSIVLLERAMINPTRFKASLSAIRALEATLIVLEHLKLPYQFVDSKEWQSVMLPHNTASDQLKEVSRQVAQRLFPDLDFKKDGDSMLGAEWARRKNL